jgi:HAD superfamily hydrolase (TIGR01484 family)
MDSQMTLLFTSLIKMTKVAVISGGSLEQYKKEFINSLPKDANLSNLLLLPTDGTAFYTWSESNHDWDKVYQESLTEYQKSQIMNAFNDVLVEAKFDKKDVVGKLIEDKVSAMTFSALGQDALLSDKEKWDPDQKKRLILKSLLEKILPNFEIRIAGTTSIDITQKGQDKSFGIRKILDYTKISIDQMLYIGDSLFDGGNDSPVKRTGIETFVVKNPEETKQIIRNLIQ